MKWFLLSIFTNSRSYPHFNIYNLLFDIKIILSMSSNCYKITISIRFADSRYIYIVVSVILDYWLCATMTRTVVAKNNLINVVKHGGGWSGCSFTLISIIIYYVLFIFNFWTKKNFNVNTKTSHIEFVEISRKLNLYIF